MGQAFDKPFLYFFMEMLWAKKINRKGFRPSTALPLSLTAQQRRLGSGQKDKNVRGWMTLCACDHNESLLTCFCLGWSYKLLVEEDGSPLPMGLHREN